jgi:hypothetical protein
MANFIVQFPLRTEKFQEDILDRRFEIGRKIYNSLVIITQKRYKEMIKTKIYRVIKAELRHLQNLRLTKRKVSDIMKKMLSIIFATSILLCGCSNSTPADIAVAETTLESTTETTVEETTAATITTTIETTAATTIPITENPDVRNVKWGMTISEVKDCESEQLKYEESNVLWYENVLVSGKYADMYYFFDDNGKLYQAGYFFTKKYSTDDLYISAYNEMKEKFDIVYGNANEEWTWLDSTFRDYYGTNYSGLHIAAGRLRVVSTWETDTSDIRLGLMGSDYTISHVASYRDKNYVEPTDLRGI